MTERLMFKLSIECESPAFRNVGGEDRAGLEVAAILKKLNYDTIPPVPTKLLENGKWPVQRLTDKDGNTVGWAEFEVGDPDEVATLTKKLADAEKLIAMFSPDLVEKFRDLIWQTEN